MLVVDDVFLKIGSIQILNGVSFTVKKGETVGIIGPNGCGKTTLFNAISGFLPITKGRILLGGEEIDRLAPFVRARRGIGRVFQDSGILHEMSVLENMVLALESDIPWHKTFFPWGVKSKEYLSEASRCLEDVGLSAVSGQKGASLSGGQKRLLEISRTLAMGASVLLLDEPTAGVSPKMKGNITEMMLKLKRDERTILVIEHDINFIQGFCDRILVMDSGKVVLDGNPENVRSDPKLQEIYFGGDGGSASESPNPSN